MTEQGGVCADGDIVSVVWLSELEWEPNGPGLNVAQQQSSGMEPTCFSHHIGVPFSSPSEALALGLPGEPAPVSLEGACQLYKLSGPSEGPQAWRRWLWEARPIAQSQGRLKLWPTWPGWT